MDAAQITVTVAGGLMIAGVLFFFFGGKGKRGSRR